MTHTLFRVLPSCVLILMATGCVQRSPILDDQFGASVTLLKAQQVLNPDASRNDDPVAGIDGKAGKSAYDQYQKSYQAQEAPSNAFSIGIGGR